MSGTACLHSTWVACPESVLAVNYHWAEDLGISASHAETPHHLRGLQSPS